MIIKKKKNNKQDFETVDSQRVNSTETGGSAALKNGAEDSDINLFDLDNIDFKQRNERRKGDRRRGFRRIDDRNLVSRAREEANAIKEAAAKEGYQEGLKEIKSDVEAVRDAIKSFYSAPQEVYDAIAPDILEISLDIAKKIIKREVSQDDSIILENIKDIMKGLSKEESKITLNVNPNQAVSLKQELPEVAKSLGLEVKLYVVPDESIAEGGCVVTTTNGVIDSTIDSQLAVISEVMKGI